MTRHDHIPAEALPLLIMFGRRKLAAYQGGRHTQRQAELRKEYKPNDPFPQPVKRLRCAVCGGVFYCRYAGRLASAMYCSEECRAAARAERRRRSQTKRACAACAKPFTPKRSDARYCGDTCRQRAHRAAAAKT